MYIKFWRKESFLKVHLIEINFCTVKYHSNYAYFFFFFLNHSFLRTLRFCLNCNIRNLFRIASKNNGFVLRILYVITVSIFGSSCTSRKSIGITFQNQTRYYMTYIFENQLILKRIKRWYIIHDRWTDKKLNSSQILFSINLYIIWTFKVLLTLFVLWKIFDKKKKIILYIFNSFIFF